MSALIAIAVLTLLCLGAIQLARTAAHRIRYALELRHLPRVTEWQARKNAAPLTSAIMERHALTPDRGDD